jgi:hypothetical protein
MRKKTNAKVAVVVTLDFIIASVLFIAGGQPDSKTQFKAHNDNLKMERRGQRG